MGLTRAAVPLLPSRVLRREAELEAARQERLREERERQRVEREQEEARLAEQEERMRCAASCRRHLLQFALAPCLLRLRHAGAALPACCLFPLTCEPPPGLLRTFQGDAAARRAGAAADG